SAGPGSWVRRSTDVGGGPTMFARGDGSRRRGAPDRRQERAGGEMIRVVWRGAAGGPPLVANLATRDSPSRTRNRQETLRRPLLARLFLAAFGSPVGGGA